jgi:hypothetical protein
MRAEPKRSGSASTSSNFLITLNHWRVWRLGGYNLLKSSFGGARSMKTQQWEYLVVYLQDSEVAKNQPEMDVYLDADKFTDQMNKYGQAGWELVSFSWAEKGAKAAFKRAKQESKRKKAVQVIDD